VEVCTTHSFRIHEIAGHQLNHLGSHPCAVSG
jgi:hypothetical protein